MHYLAAHSYLYGALGMWVFSALVSAMPALPDNAGYGWRWAYGFLHALSANLDKLKATISPPAK